MAASDDVFPWGREGDESETKYVYTVHSELNAILNYRGGSLEGAKLYVSLFPCNEWVPKQSFKAGLKRLSMIAINTRVQSSGNGFHEDV